MYIFFVKKQESSIKLSIINLHISINYFIRPASLKFEKLGTRRVVSSGNFKVIAVFNLRNFIYKGEYLKTNEIWHHFSVEEKKKCNWTFDFFFNL